MGSQDMCWFYISIGSFTSKEVLNFKDYQGKVSIMKKTKGKKWFSMLLSALLMLMSFPGMAVLADESQNGIAENSVAVIGNTGYESLAAAVAAVPADNTETTITLLKTTTGGGVVVKANQNIIFDFAGKTYTVDATVGSAGTETNGFQLLQNATVTLKNGTLTSTTAKILVQNYSHLTLDTMVLDGTRSSVCEYTASNNCGSMTVTGNSQLLAAEGRVAFDMWYGMSQSYADEGIRVTFDEDFTGRVQGKIEYGTQKTSEGWQDKTSLVIQGGTFEGEFSESSANALQDANIVISGGSFSTDVSDFAADGNKAVQQPDGSFVIGTDPETAVAEVNGKGYVSINEAIQAARKGDTILLLKDHTESITIPGGKDITLKLPAGVTLTNENGKHTVTVASNASLIITGEGTIDNVSHAKAALVNESGAKTIIRSGKLTRSKEASTSAADNGGNSYYVILNQGTMEIAGGEVINTGYYSSLICNKGIEGKKAELTVSGGALTQKGFIAVKNDDYSKLAVTGGVITSDEQTVQNWSEANITGGTFNGNIITWAYDGFASVTNISGTAVVNGDVCAVNYADSADIPTVNISGGTINGQIRKGAHSGSSLTWVEAGNTASDINISGGSFKNPVDGEFCEEGFEPTKNNDGTYGVCDHAGGSYIKGAVAPTCTDEGYTGDEICKNCGEILKKGSAIPANGHKFGEKWSNDGENHWHVCAVCGEKADMASHIYGEWKVTKEATASEKGTREAVCTVCGHTIAETIPAKGSAPVTGETGNYTVRISLLAASLAGMGMIFMYSRKTRRGKHSA